MVDPDKVYEEISERLDPLLDYIEDQEGHVQTTCVLFCVSNIARLLAKESSLGVLEHSKYLILSRKPNKVEIDLDIPNFIC